ncbi:hypothetical protein ES703_84276 [subsurface metagenome]
MEKWQEQVEAILKEHYQDDEGMLKAANELIGLIKEAEVPSGDAGQFIARVLNLVASEGLPPLVVTYIGFRLGVAYARYKNINWSSGEPNSGN